MSTPLPPEMVSGPHDPASRPGLTQVSGPQAGVVVSGLGLTGFLYADGVPLQTALGATVAAVAGLVMLVQAPREIIEMIKLLREIKRLGSGREP
jgi:hypothetical protein